MGPGEAMVGMTLFLSISAVAILRGPLGKAIAERISGQSLDHAGRSEDIERLHAELDEVKHRLAETEDRLDFAERFLARQRDQPGVGPGR